MLLSDKPTIKPQLLSFNYGTYLLHSVHKYLPWSIKALCGAHQHLRLHLRDLDCRVNLIRFHQIPGVDLKGADDKTMESLRDYLNNHGINTTIRASRGQDIYAACGLLTTAAKEKLMFRTQNNG